MVRRNRKHQNNRCNILRRANNMFSSRMPVRPEITLRMLRSFLRELALFLPAFFCLSEYAFVLVARVGLVASFFLPERQFPSQFAFILFALLSFLGAFGTSAITAILFGAVMEKTMEKSALVGFLPGLSFFHTRVIHTRARCGRLHFCTGNEQNGE